MNYSGRHVSLRNLISAASLFLGTVCLFVGIFCWYGTGCVRIEFSETYYLLVRTCEKTTSAAVVGDVSSSGGAGILYNDHSVVIACYFEEADALVVCATLTDRFEASVMTARSKPLYLFGKDRKCAERIRSNIRTADACARLLFDTANGLSNTEYSQEEATARVEGVAKAIAGLCIENSADLFGEWNVCLRAIGDEAHSVADGIVFAKNVRTLQTKLCIAVSRASELFS